MKTMVANRCNYGRQALQTAYESFNVAVHTMGVAVSTLCGCTFVLDQAKCVMQNVPPVCIFPYNAYSRLFASSVQLWEAVKASTKTCLMHGDAAVSS